MRKQVFIAMIGILVIALAATSTVLALNDSPSSSAAADTHPWVAPTHWWKVDVDADPLEVLQGLWGKSMPSLKLGGKG